MVHMTVGVDIRKADLVGFGIFVQMRTSQSNNVPKIVYPSQRFEPIGPVARINPLGRFAAENLRDGGCWDGLFMKHLI
jgi:hypothetical protein